MLKYHLAVRLIHLLQGVYAKKGYKMKVHIEIDLTPEEARTLAGLPNYEQMHKAFLNAASGKMENSMQSVDVEPMMKAWADLGGIAQDSFNNMLKAAMSGSKSFDFNTNPKADSEK